jgi:hypothetical protein
MSDGLAELHHSGEDRNPGGTLPAKETALAPPPEWRKEHFPIFCEILKGVSEQSFAFYPWRNDQRLLLVPRQ